MKRLVALLILALPIAAQTPGPLAKPSEASSRNPSAWWVHVSVAAHVMAATQDGLSSWKQDEANRFYAQPTGSQAGHFYRTGAARLAGITLGIGAASELLGAIKPKWRKCIGILNFGAAAAHVGVTTYNVARNPYYR